LLRDYRCLHPAAGEQAEELVFHHTPQSGCRPSLGKQIVRVRGQDLQQATVPRHHGQVHDTSREDPAVGGVCELDRAPQDAVDLRQTRIPGVREGYA
jgi:hypothetical protein